MLDAGLTELQRTRSLAALAEITRPSSVGNFIGRVDAEDGSYSLLFECLLQGYPGWQWNVSLAEVDGDDPTVLEAELLPTEGALVAPDWVPWSQRLAEYLEAQKQAGIDEEAALAQMQAEAGGDEDDLESFDEEESDDDDSDDEDDFEDSDDDESDEDEEDESDD
ncbi:MAG: hypothetical protein RLZZ600_1327 [Actinomycetota bacterium]